jgi:tetratricopeptide (TPR) repeat protein
LSKNVFDADTLAWCYYKNGEYDRAKAAIGRALRLKTPDARILFHAGMIHAKLGESGPARKYLNNALSLNPHFSLTEAEVAAATLKRLGGGQVARGQG